MAESRITDATRRSRQMMIGGLVGAHAAGVLFLLLAVLVGGPGAVLTTVLALAVLTGMKEISRWRRIGQ